MLTSLQSPETFHSNDPVLAHRFHDPDPKPPRDKWLRMGLFMFLCFVAFSLSCVFFYMPKSIFTFKTSAGVFIFELSGSDVGRSQVICQEEDQALAFWST